ncbi:OmpA family protein [Candidatus Steffania adelgidicola]|uniref:OmpA family protein n=1 Tax=Candidatus Steffania adelgidicola TaxID=1076626 RepID=UPI001D0358B4|nr:OmpA family protein [Candidatus Steffania adelgidicola]
MWISIILALPFYKRLNAHASFLRRNSSQKVVIEGYIDQNETPEYNIALCECRADAVKIYLQSKGAAAK